MTSPLFDPRRPLSEHPDAAAFRRTFVADHIEAIGFLLGQRRAWLEDGDLPWRELCMPSARQENHVRALRASEPDVEACVAAALLVDDEDALRGAAFVTTALAPGTMPGLAERAATAAPELVRALEDGVCFAPAGSARAAAVRLIESGAKAFGARVLARTPGAAEAVLRALLDDDDVLVRTEAGLALAAAGDRASQRVLETLATPDHPGLERVLLALLALDVAAGRGVVARMLAAGGEVAATCPLATALADPSAYVELTTRLEQAPAVAHASGHLGQPRLLPSLLAACAPSSAPEIRHAAARAVERISGCRLADDESMVDDDEPVALDTADAEAWLEERRRRGELEVRFRRGQPWHEEMPLTELEAPCRRLTDRRSDADELAIRSGPAPFDPAGDTAMQEAALEQWRRAGQRPARRARRR